MLQRPKVLDLFSLFLLAVAASFPIQVMFIYGHSPLEIGAVLAKITTLNWIVMLVLSVNAWIVHKASPSMKWTLPMAALLVGFNNFVVGQWGLDFSLNQTWIATGAFAVAHAVLFRKNISELVRHPEKRWWLTPVRRKVELTAYVNPFNGLAFKTKTFDISEGGAFLKLTDDSVPKRGTNGVRNRQLSVDDRVSLCLTLGLAQIRCDGRIIRNCDSKGEYPTGIGVSFEGMPRHQKRELRRFIDSQA